MKAKIQAQRKFAQGAPIPAGNSSAERRLEVTQNKEQRNVIRNNIHPKALLDFISFNQIHEHEHESEIPEPVVLLERLKTNPTNTYLNQTAEEMEVETIEPQPSTSGISDRDVMRLRSHITVENSSPVNNVPIESNQPVLNEEKENKAIAIKQANQGTPYHMITNVSSNTSDVSVDEDQPLVYFVGKNKQALNKKPKRKRGSVKKERVVTKHRARKNKKTQAGSRGKKINDISSESQCSSENITDNSDHTTNETIIELENNESSDACDLLIQSTYNLSDSEDDEELMGYNECPPDESSMCSNESNSEDMVLITKVDDNKSTNINKDDDLLSMIPEALKDVVEEWQKEYSNNDDRQNYSCETFTDVDEIKDDIEYYDTMNDWEEFFAMDLDIFEGPSDQVLHVKCCSNKKIQKSKPLVACSLILKSESCIKHNSIIGVQDPNVLFAYLGRNFNFSANENVYLETENEIVHISTDGISYKKKIKNIPIEDGDLPSTSSSDTNIALDRTITSPNPSVNTDVVECIDISDSETDEQPNTSNKNKSGSRVNIPKCNKSHKHSATSGISTPEPDTYGKFCLDAPVFRPTAEEFVDPVGYFDYIMPEAIKYGICKIIPPAGFTPSCTVNDEMVFTVVNQYIGRLFTRWGPSAKELCTIKAYLASQGVVFKRSPLYEGMEVNLPKLYKIVQHHGGLKKVIERKRWGRVAEEMRFTKGPNPEKKLDQLYVKYLLPYATLSSLERSELIANVERVWSKIYRKMMERANVPLLRQYKMLADSETSEEEDSEDDDLIMAALAEAEECTVPGRKMNLATFKKIAIRARDTFFNHKPSPSEVEQEFWRLVLHGDDHLCVYSASVDTGPEGYGFTNNEDDPLATHPWNLKMMLKNKRNVINSLGSLLGVTVPTLHLGMAFSTSCWHRDPHGLPWMEYMHSGPPKIWYGISEEESTHFRKVVELLCPTSYQNKSIWLPSDIVMVPPHMLLEHNVSLSRVEQLPGEYIIVFPKAYSCTISTGFNITESVYFASRRWLNSGLLSFVEAQYNCEPTMISVEVLLVAIVTGERISLSVLEPALVMLDMVFAYEKMNRLVIKDFRNVKRITMSKHEKGVWNVRDKDECVVCRKPLFLSRVTGLTKNNTLLCLTHAICILEKKETNNRSVPPFQVEYFFCNDEMDEIWEQGRQRLLTS
ncbi:uncharacterized protein Jarid2 isoform X2 [Epargyreus clarus]|uniref:uncharacterized protein Jarid2 isoform X2 n=1 Tax=Epargyreus clarus TaxID=520877 RepID=UPI003C2ED4EC